MSRAYWSHYITLLNHTESRANHSLLLAFSVVRLWRWAFGLEDQLDQLFRWAFWRTVRLRFTKAKKEKVLKLKLRKTLPKVHAPGPQLQFLDDDSLESLDSIFLSCITLISLISAVAWPGALTSRTREVALSTIRQREERGAGAGGYGMGCVGYGMVWLSLWTQNNQNNQRTGSWSHFFKGNTLCLDFTDRLVNQPHFLTTRQLVLTRNLMVTYGDHDRVLAEFQTRRLVAGINTEWIHFHTTGSTSLIIQRL